MKNDLIILSGWGVQSFVWQPLVDLLQPKYEVSIVTWEDLSTLEDFKAKAIDVMQKKAVDAIQKNRHKKFTLIGWSLGSMVTLDLSISHSSQIDKMILISPTSKFVQDESYKVGWHEKIVRHMLAKLNQSTDKVLEQFYKQLFSSSEKDAGYYTAFLEALQNVKQNFLKSDLELGLEYLLHKDVREDLSKIKIPVLLIHGEKDVTVPLEAGLYLNQQIKQSELVVFKDMGHMPFYTHTLGCYEAFMNYLHSAEGDEYD